MRLPRTIARHRAAPVRSAGLLLAALLSGCGGSADDYSADDVVADESTRIDAFFQQAWDARLDLQPQLASVLGRREHYDRWNDISEAGQQAIARLVANQLKQLSTQFDYDSLDGAHRLSYDLFVADGNFRLDQYRWRNHTYPVNQMNGLQSAVPSFLINVHQVASVDDAVAYVGRLEGIAPLFRQLEAGLELRAKLGVIPPRFVFPLVLGDARNVISGRPFDASERDSALLEDFARKVEALDIDAERRAALIGAATRALVESVGPAYRSLIAALERLAAQATTDDGVWKLPDGAAYYAFQLHAATTTNMSAEAIHRLGLAEVARIHDEMDAVMARVAFKGSRQEFFASLRTDPRFYLPETAQGRDEYLARARAALASMHERLGELFLTEPRAELVVKAVEPFRAESAGKAFYQQPAPDGSRPGIYYVNLHKMSDMPLYELEALAFHEGIPGHHMQRATALELTSIPEFRKQFAATAYTEGWGLYAERLAREIGYYGDPYADFGRLSMELWRACRLVVDTGIHAKRWTREEAIQYLLDNTAATRGAATKAIERYIVMPGQATAYTIGMLKILEMRGNAAAALGEAFDIREFHDVVLSAGPMPLDRLKRQVDGYVVARRSH